MTEMEFNSAEQTINFARDLGKKLVGGEVIELIGDVGAGKTTFVKGLAEGLGSKDHVSSPTFTVHNIYKGRLTLHHCDFYRLHDDSLISKEIGELLEDKKAVVVLEWAAELRPALPEKHIIIRFNVTSENVRKIKVEDLE